MKIINKLKRMMHLLGIGMKSFSAKYVIAGTPLHGNLGDQAIVLGEKEFLKDYFPRDKVIEIDGDFVRRLKAPFLKLIVGNKTILINGGGFLGDLYMREENMVRKLIRLFPQNKIVIFPQTLYFGEGEVEKNKTINIYEKHKNLHLCLRENYSFDLAKSLFSNVKVYLIPDMVLYIKRVNNKTKENTCIFCMRKDKEAILQASDVLRMKDICRDRFESGIKETDTVVGFNILEKYREKYVYGKINEFASAKCVITDRLHGMVMAYLARTEVYVFDNCNYKVKGVYNWIKENKRVHLVESVEKFEEILDTKIESDDSNVNLHAYYDRLADIIRS